MGPIPQMSFSIFKVHYLIGICFQAQILKNHAQIDAYLVHHHRIPKQKVSKLMEAEDIYHGLMLNLSNCSNMKRMQACLNVIALKASDNSYISETFSTEISFMNKIMNHQPTSQTFYIEIFLGSISKSHQQQLSGRDVMKKKTDEAHLSDGIFAVTFKAIQKILICGSQYILSNI